MLLVCLYVYVCVCVSVYTCINADPDKDKRGCQILGCGVTVLLKSAETQTRPCKSNKGS